MEAQITIDEKKMFNYIYRPMLVHIDVNDMVHQLKGRSTSTFRGATFEAVPR
jgi:hypothetical protein